MCRWSDGGDDNDGVGCDDGVGDGTEKCGADRDVFGLAEGINVGHVEGYNRGVSGGLDCGEEDGCRYVLMDGVHVGDGLVGGGG